MASLLTLQELQAFHTIDRTIYARLVVDLGLEPHHSKKVLAFWNFLETTGYGNFVSRMLTVPDGLLNALAMEAITCLNCLNKELFPPPFIDDDNHSRLMRTLVSPDFSLSFVHENRHSAIRKMENFMENVCERVFSDIVPRNLTNVTQSLQPQCGIQHSHMIVNAPPVMPIVSHTDRTLFMTFSKGHPITKEELKELIARKFGNCVEAIYMKGQPKMEPLFARVVLRSSSDIAEILGGKEVAKFSVNGKDVRARRFVSKPVC